MPKCTQKCQQNFFSGSGWPTILQNAQRGAFCNTFDLHYVTIGLENQFVVFLRIVVLDRFYCILCIEVAMYPYGNCFKILNYYNLSVLKRNIGYQGWKSLNACPNSKQDRC